MIVDIMLVKTKALKMLEEKDLFGGKEAARKEMAGKGRKGAARVLAAT